MRWINYRREGEVANIGLNLPVGHSFPCLRFPVWVVQSCKWLEDFCSHSEILVRHQWQCFVIWKWHGFERPPYFQAGIYDIAIGEPISRITQEMICDRVAVSMV